MRKQIEVRCECSPKLIAFFKGTAGEFNKLGPLALTIMSMAAQMRNHVSPYTQRPCAGCDGKGFINVANGPDDFDKETCVMCGGTGRVVANH
jgi:hypothetical protein